MLNKLYLLKAIIQKESSISDSQKKFTNVEFKGNTEVLNSDIGEYTYISKNSIVHNAHIGKFCSIGPNVVIGYGDHPTNFLSTSPKIYYREIFSGEDVQSSYKVYESNKYVSIGNDVWIGANVYIKNGVNIGDGAIVGAGAVVTKDLAPYTINVGLPANSIKKRFSEDIIESLLNLKWWLYPIDQIEKIKPYLSETIDTKVLVIIRQLLNESK